mgnify:CR=1 FL=1
MKLREKCLTDCIQILDRELPARVDTLITHFRSIPLQHVTNKSFQELVGDNENDTKQQTQAGTKIIQNWVNLCITDIIIEYDLPIKGADSKGSDLRYIGNGCDVPIEVKCSGGKDGATACIGNLKVLDSKCELTLVFRFAVRDNRIAKWQTVTIDGSARKWTEYNNQSGSSNFSALKCKSDIDFQDITVYSGSIKPNSSWVKFVKEDVVVRGKQDISS